MAEGGGWWREPGPLELRIWRSLPFLPPVPTGVLAGGGQAEAQAMDRRARVGGHLCLFCGEPARIVLVARPQGAELTAGVQPRFVDLCMPDYSALLAEVRDSYGPPEFFP